MVQVPYSGLSPIENMYFGIIKTLLFYFEFNIAGYVLGGTMAHNVSAEAEPP